MTGGIENQAASPLANVFPDELTSMVGFSVRVRIGFMTRPFYLRDLELWLRAA